MIPTFIVSNNWDHTECGEAAGIALQWLTFHLPGVAVVAVSDGSPEPLYEQLATGGGRLIHAGQSSGLDVGLKMAEKGRKCAMILLHRPNDINALPTNFEIHTIPVAKTMNKFEFFRRLEKILALYNDKPVRPKTDRLTAR